MKYLQIHIAAIVATVAWMLFMWSAPLMGLPRLHIADTMRMVYGGNRMVVWFLFISFRFILAFAYVLLLNHWLPIKNNVLRGMCFGVVVFVYSESTLLFTHLVRQSPTIFTQNFFLGSLSILLGSLVFGGVLGAFFKRDF